MRFTKRALWVLLFVLGFAVMVGGCGGGGGGNTTGEIPIVYDPEFKYVALETGIKIAYVELGNANGPPVVLIHGVTDSYISFSQVAPRIASAGFRVIVPELRGHGHSDKPQQGTYTVDDHVADINALLNHLQIKDAHITGHSLGSFVTQGLAALHPDKVSSITLIASAGVVAGNETLHWLLEGDADFAGINHLTELSDEFLTDWTIS
ncbi:MAG: alpha/beta hydrolase, partial [Synergistaceae bacterium]|nr:alpha/beta hydrolase [Synergistaceae bacterium]